MKNGVFGEYFARFEGIWQTKCFQDAEVDTLRVERKGKYRGELPMIAMTMMKRNTIDDEKVYLWWRGSERNKQSEMKGEEGDNEEEK